MTAESTVKHPADSFYEKVLHFGTDPVLRDAYINSFGDLRFGKLLEEMDMAAGAIAYAHADGFALDLTIVTASCDSIELLSPLPSTKDLRLQGQVNYVGRSSMEVGIHLDLLTEGEWKLVVRAFFIMVARKHDRSYAVHPLEPVTPEDHRRHREALLRQEQRRDEYQSHFTRSAPSAEESAMLHEVFLKTLAGDIDGVYMRDTWRQATVIVHPQNRNIHNKIFGGHLMRLSFETAYTVAHLHCHRRPWFLRVDQFDFIEPVEIGSIVSFNGQITYTGHTSFVIEVTVEVVNPRTGKKHTTNISNYTFVAVDDCARPIPVPKVYPHSYEEGLRYLDGAKRYKRAKIERQKRQEGR